jgi:hypothetical protein
VTLTASALDGFRKQVADNQAEIARLKEESKAKATELPVGFTTVEARTGQSFRKRLNNSEVPGLPSEAAFLERLMRE